MQGVIRTFDPGTNEGVVVRDTDKAEIVLAADALEGSIFRMLRQGQRVNFELDGQEPLPPFATVGRSVMLGSLGKKSGFGVNVMGKNSIVTGRVPRVLKSGVLWMAKHHSG